MKRSSFKPRQQTLRQRAKLKKKGVNPMKVGSTGRRLAPKAEAPIESKEHWQLVNRQPCIISGHYMGGDPCCVGHHPRGLFNDRTMGKRITDFLLLPLRADLHDGYGHSLHKAGNEEAWWTYNGWPKEAVFKWLRKFLLKHYPKDHPGVVQAFAKMKAEEDRSAT